MSDLIRLLRLFRPYRLWVVGGIAASTGVVLANVGLLALSGWFIAGMALAGLGGPGIEYFAPAAAIRALAILRTGGRYVERLVTHEATFRLLSELRVWFYQHLEPLAPARLQRHRGGDLLSRIRSDIDSLDNLYLRVIAPTTAAGITAVLMVAFLALFSRAAAMVVAAGLVLTGTVLPLLAQRFGRAPAALSVATRSALRADVSDMVRGLGEMLVFGADHRQLALLKGRSVELVSAQRRQTIVSGVSTATSGLVAHLVMWGAVVVVIPLVVSKALPSPDLAMVALFVLAGFEATAPLPSAFQALGETLAAARRIFEIVDAEPVVSDPRPGHTPPTRFDLRVERLRMRYDESAPWALDGVDLHIHPGRSLGIVGASGSGKTSLLSVLLRFWDYQDGTVEIGGVPLRALRGETVRSLCAVVAQQSHLFNASIRENLTLAQPSADDATLEAALARVGILDEVMAMPDGLDTFVGETGTRLSGGQARRIVIARALLKDAPILLLDEPTEGLDARSEDLVLDALAVLMRGRTTILVTHRTQALRLVDDVVTFERGRCEGPACEHLVGTPRGDRDLDESPFAVSGERT